MAPQRQRTPTHVGRAARPLAQPPALESAALEPDQHGVNTPPRLDRPARVQALQLALGNRQISRLLGGRILRDDGLTAAPPASTGAAPASAPAADRLADDDEVNAIIDGFSDAELKQQITGSINNRRDFLRGMQQYLGGLDDVIAHFAQIRLAAVPGEVHLHSSAAARLELVAAKLAASGAVMPATTVALGLRGRYRPHERHGRGLIAHPAGYAIDYRAVTNPMIRDQRLVELLNLNAGPGGSTMQLGQYTNYKSRRDLIRQMGQASAAGGIDPASPLGQQARAFTDLLTSEHQRLAATSQAFTQNLSPGLLALKEVRQQSRERHARLKQLRKQRGLKGDAKTANEQAIAVLEVEAANLSQQEGALRLRLPELVAPWVAQVQQQIDAIAAQVRQVDPSLELSKLPGKQELAKQRAALQRQRSQAERARRQAERRLARAAEKLAREGQKIVDLDTAMARLAEEQPRQAGGAGEKRLASKLAQAEARRAASATRQGQIEQERSDAGAERARQAEVVSSCDQSLKQVAALAGLLPHKQRHATLSGLQQKLTDQDFFFEGKRNAEDPAVMQLIEEGFFTPDKALAVGADPEQADPNSHGFDATFVKTMAEFGFDLGMAWSPGSSDPMHFELIEGLDRLK